jgi:hypothetical protein
MPQFAVEFHPLAAGEVQAAERGAASETGLRRLVFSRSSLERSI